MGRLPYVGAWRHIVIVLASGLRKSAEIKGDAGARRQERETGESKAARPPRTARRSQRLAIGKKQRVRDFVTGFRDTMGQKVHPYDFASATPSRGKSRWFVERDYDKLLLRRRQTEGRAQREAQVGRHQLVEIRGVPATAAHHRSTARPASSSGARAPRSTSSRPIFKFAASATCIWTFRNA